MAKRKSKKSTNKSKRILVMGDTHCGHIAGLTPPEWHFNSNNKSSITLKKRNVFAKLQKEMWNWYIETIESLKPFDTLFCMGDLIDGRGEASGGTELLTTDCNEQCEWKYYRIGPETKFFLGTVRWYTYS